MFIEQAFDRFLGYEYARLEDGSIEIRLEVKELYVNSAGYVHGGILSSLADVAMSNLVPPDANGQQQIVTVDLKTSFVRPATGRSLLGKASVINEGKRLLHAECQIYNDQGKLVANAVGIFSRL